MCPIVPIYLKTFSQVYIYINMFSKTMVQLDTTASQEKFILINYIKTD